MRRTTMQISVKQGDGFWSVVDDGLLYDNYPTEAEANTVAEHLRSQDELYNTVVEAVSDLAYEIATRYDVSIDKVRTLIRQEA
jgi:hypothetical protein